jgi:hypothetical protein
MRPDQATCKAQPHSSRSQLGGRRMCCIMRHSMCTASHCSPMRQLRPQVAGRWHAAAARPAVSNQGHEWEGRTQRQHATSMAGSIQWVPSRMNLSTSCSTTRMSPALADENSSFIFARRCLRLARPSDFPSTKVARAACAEPAIPCGKRALLELGIAALAPRRWHPRTPAALGACEQRGSGTGEYWLAERGIVSQDYSTGFWRWGRGRSGARKAGRAAKPGSASGSWTFRPRPVP